MKKTKLIALTMAVAIMLMGAGYAIWSDQVFLDTTVRTGKFDMAITSLTTRTGDREDANLAHKWHQYDWTHSGEKSFNANQATVEFLDLYPGGVVQLDMMMKNLGTIPAKLVSVDVEQIGGNEKLYEYLQANTTWKADIDGKAEPNEEDKYGHVNKQWYSVDGAMEALVADLTKNNIIIEPNRWLKLGDDTEAGCIYFRLNPDAENDLQNKSVKLKFTFNWEQWASDSDSNPYTNYGGNGDFDEPRN